jgi:hypothetical protein
VQKSHETTESIVGTETRTRIKPKVIGALHLEEMNRITERINGAAIDVHRPLGPGLLESAYQACLVHELRQQGLEVEK